MRSILLVFAAAGVLAAADIPNLTGTWKLDVQKSHWGNKKDKPATEVLTIKHNEPNLDLSGTVAYDRERTDRFEYNGPLDGKEHTIPDGTISLKRVDPYTIDSVWKSHDGRWVENGRTTLSKDGKTLTRRIELKRPEGDLKWTEVYTKAS
jgi:hypothetical protein